VGLFGSPARVLAVLYVYLSAGLTLMITVFRAKIFLKKYDDFRSFLLYFSFFFLILMAVPLAIIAVGAPSPRELLISFGWTPGRIGKGFFFMAVSVPIALLAAFIGSRDPLMKKYYPFSKQACSSLKKFALYESAYLVFYYLPWEFVFRGLLFFPLIPAVGLVPALALETALSTLYHIGHPDTEIFSALGAGFIFGLIAYATSSFFYTVFIHALVGIGNDTLLYLRYYRPHNAPR
jgi:membrane protease YdiL (CAAX protease family)